MEKFQLRRDEGHLHFTEPMKKDLMISSYWSSFISIFAITITALATLSYILILFRAFSVSEMPFTGVIKQIPLEGFLLIIGLLAFLVLFVLSNISLFFYALKIKEAIQHENPRSLDMSFDWLMKFFRYNGMLIILSLVIGFISYTYFSSFWYAF